MFKSLGSTSLNKTKYIITGSRRAVILCNLGIQDCVINILVGLKVGFSLIDIKHFDVKSNKWFGFGPILKYLCADFFVYHYFPKNYKKPFMYKVIDM